MVLAIGLLGLACGSFVNAAVWRLHQQQQAILRLRSGQESHPSTALRTGRQKANYSIISGRSMCPNCAHRLRATDLVPLISWLSLKGRCRYCHKPIGLHYPLVELITAALFLWSYVSWQFNDAFSYIYFGFWLAILVGLVILTIYDLRWLILPDRVQLPLIGLALALLGMRVINQSGLNSVFSPALAALLAGGFFYGLYALSNGKWMGGGDFKLAILIGLLLGLAKTALALLIAFNLAAAISIVMIALKLRSRKDLIPFGPFLIFGLFIAQLYGIGLIGWYLRFVGA